MNEKFPYHKRDTNIFTRTERLLQLKSEKEGSKAKMSITRKKRMK